MWGHHYYFITKLFFKGKVFLPKPEGKLESSPLEKPLRINSGTWENHSGQKSPIHSFLSVCLSFFSSSRFLLFGAIQDWVLCPEELTGHNKKQQHMPKSLGCKFFRVKTFQRVNINLPIKKADSIHCAIFPLLQWSGISVLLLWWMHTITHVRHAVRCFDAVIHRVVCTAWYGSSHLPAVRTLQILSPHLFGYTVDYLPIVTFLHHRITDLFLLSLSPHSPKSPHLSPASPNQYQDLNFKYATLLFACLFKVWKCNKKKIHA